MLQSSSFPFSRLIGYARVSTEEQETRSQVESLKAAGCHLIYEEYASGASRDRPELSRLLTAVQRGDVLIVGRLDRLARSVRHLLKVIEYLETRGAHFRSLSDPIDTSTAQGIFTLQILGAVAQLERALISERTKAGMKAALRLRAGRDDRRASQGQQRGHPDARTDFLRAQREHDEASKVRGGHGEEEGRRRSQVDGHKSTGSARTHRRTCVERGAGARAVRRGLVAVWIKPPAVEHLRADRRVGGRAQDARRRAGGPRRPLGRAAVRDVPARAEVSVWRAPIRLREGALQRARHCARGLGGGTQIGAGERFILMIGMVARRPAEMLKSLTS